LLNASTPDGVGVLNHNVGAVPANTFVTELILYTLLNVDTLKLFANCKTFPNALQFLNVDENDVTFGQVSNNVDGTDVKDVQLKKQDANVVAFVTSSNKPEGTVVIGVLENASVNIVAFGE
jgi:hypothetical protein